MAETGSQILTYTGNANSGLGANSAIPVSAEKPELDAVQQASQNLRLYDHQDNVLKYQQKIADRDKALQLLAQGKVNAGKILPEDQKHYDEAEKAQTEAYKAIKGMQDKDGIANYLSTTQKLQDLVTNAQHRWIEVTKLEDEKAKQSLPKDVQAYADHIAKQRAKPIGELVDPYQSAFSFDDDKLRKGIIGGQMISKGIGGGLPPQEPQTITVTDANGKKTTKTVTAPLQKVLPGTKVKSGSTIPQNGELSAFQETPERYYDLPTMLKRSEQLYVGDPEQMENQRQLFTKFHEAPDFIQEDLINKYNDRIRTYNEQRGFNPDDNLIKAKNVGGKFILQETPSSFAAKHTLATIEGDYVEKPQKTFNKDIANYNLELLKYKGDLENDRGKRAIEWAKFNLDKKKFDSANKEDFASAASVINEATSIINKGDLTKVEVGNGTIDVLRIGDPNLLLSFGNVDKDGKITNPPDAISYNKDNDQLRLIYYKGKTASGKNIIDKEVPLDQRTWLKKITQRSFPGKDIGKINNLVDEILDKNSNSLTAIADKRVDNKATTYTAKMPDGSLITSSDGVTWYDKKGKKIE